MTRTITLSHHWLAMLVLAPALLSWTLPARAADEDTQLWISLNTIVPLGGDTRGTFEISPRARRQGDLMLLRGTVEAPAAEWAKVGAGAAYLKSNGGSEVRAFQQVTLEAGPVAFRTRVEQRLIEGEPRAQLRLLQRVGTNIPLTERTTLTGYAEVFYIVRTENLEDKARIDSWRASAGVQQRLSPHLTAGFSYLMILSPREGRPDRISHVRQVTLVFRP